MERKFIDISKTPYNNEQFWEKIRVDRKLDVVCDMHRKKGVSYEDCIKWIGDDFNVLQGFERIFHGRSLNCGEGRCVNAFVYQNECGGYDPRG